MLYYAHGRETQTDREVMQMYALLSNQGTAMHETALTSVEYLSRRARERAELNAPADAAMPLRWADVSDNEAFQPSDEEIAEWFARKYPSLSV
jgi:hypothetical protein